MKRVRENNWTIREMCQHLAGEGGSAVIGTAADICDRMEAWMDAECCDGFQRDLRTSSQADARISSAS